MVALLTPVPDIPVQVEQPQVVRLLAPHRPATLLGILQIPAVLPQQLLRLPVIPACHRSRSARILPFRLRRQPITRQTQIVLLQLRHSPLRARLVAPLSIRNPLLAAQPVAVFCRLIPGGAYYWTTRRRSISLRESVFLVKTPVFRHPHRLSGNGKRPADLLPVLLLKIRPSGLRRRRSHHEFHRARNHYHRLPLTV